MKYYWIPPAGGKQTKGALAASTTTKLPSPDAGICFRRAAPFILSVTRDPGRACGPCMQTGRSPDLRILAFGTAFPLPVAVLSECSPDTVTSSCRIHTCFPFHRRNSFRRHLLLFSFLFTSIPRLSLSFKTGPSVSRGRMKKNGARTDQTVRTPQGRSSGLRLSGLFLRFLRGSLVSADGVRICGGSVR